MSSSRSVFLAALCCCLALWGAGASAEKVLRYTSKSCASLTPVYKEESYEEFGFGPREDEDEDDDEYDDDDDDDDRRKDDDDDDYAYESPKQSTRSSPFDIEFDFEGYQKNREYEIRLTSTEYFDSFMLQVRSEGGDDYDDEYREDEDEYDDDDDDRRREEDDEDYDDDDDRRDKSKRDKDKQRRENNTYAGSWTDVPGVAAVLKCGRNRLAAVVDKGRPIRLGNMTFTWRAPSSDVGRLVVRASIVYNDAYAFVESRPFRFKRFPVSTGGCGRSQSCFRACGFRPRCDAPESVYMLTMRPDLEREEITFRLGGILRDNRSYTAVGFGLDKNDLRNMDFVACTREGYVSPPPIDPYGPGEDGDDYEDDGYYGSDRYRNDNDDGRSTTTRRRDRTREPYNDDGGGGGKGNARRRQTQRQRVTFAGRDRVELRHYLLEDETSRPFLHATPIRLRNSAVDPETGFTWCTFTRDIRPRDAYDLDLTRKFYHFYFWGRLDDERGDVPVVHDKLRRRLHRSRMRLNASAPYSEVEYDPVALLLSERLQGRRRGAGCAVGAAAHLVAVLAVLAVLAGLAAVAGE